MTDNCSLITVFLIKNMKKIQTKYIAILTLLFVVLSCAKSDRPMPGGIDYNSLNVQNREVTGVFQKAKSNDKKVMLIFDAVWCGYCRMLNQRVLKDPEVKKTLAGFEVINVDVDKYPKILKTFVDASESFDGKGVPAILIFSSEGLQTDQIEGFLETEPFNRRLKQNL